MTKNRPSPLRAEVTNLNFGQEGIAEFPKYGHFATFFIKKDTDDLYERWLKVVKLTDELCAKSKGEVVCVRGVDFCLWTRWCKELKMPVPKSKPDHALLNDKPFTNSGGDLWFHIKGTTNKSCERIFEAIEKALDPVTEKIIHTPAHKMHGGKVFGGRFRDAMINPVDPVNLSNRVIVGDEDAFYRGSAFVLQQKFKHNWAQLDDKNQIEKEDMIGRNVNDAIIPMHDDRSHIKCVRQVNGERVTDRILRQALPYGQSKTGNGKEEGVYFVAYAKDNNIYHDLITNIVGPEKGFIKDKMLSNTHATSGNFWFVPSAEIIKLAPAKGSIRVPENEYFDVRSSNGYMYYNNRDFLHQTQLRKDGDEFSDRILLLLSQNFSRWNDTWEKPQIMPSPGHLRDHLSNDKWKKYQKYATSKSAALRKGLAIKISLSDVLLQEQYRELAGLHNIKPYELLVGNMPPLTLGSGTQVMEYLNEEEKIEGFFGMKNEYSATGHNIPNYKKVLRLGVGGLLKEAQQKLKGSTGETRAFYQSVIWSLEGLEAFILSYAELAKSLEESTPKTAKFERDNYAAIAKRMTKLASKKPKGLLESLQLIFIINCALHQTGEPMSIGRLDQYLIEPYLADIKAGKLDGAGAQEIIDAFWLKMDETVLYNRQHMQDYLTYGTGAVFYSAGNFPQGSALNQWVQQVTLGGYLPTNSKTPKDGCNHITLLCLKAARRLPLNAPCVSLRVHKNMNEGQHKDIIEEASKAILSGGAHPILMNDDKLVKGLLDSGPIKPEDARDYVCDGCYEPVIQGRSEWAFSYVPILPVVGMAMNQGATIAGAGWVHLRGMKNGWNSPPPETIRSFSEFLDIFYRQYTWQIAAFYNTLMNSYGSLWEICPSPLFSSMTDGCMESGRDMTNGGAEIHIVAPMMCGITNAINSLYAIKKMVFDKESAVTTLPELLQALWNNWGEDMKEPFQNEFAGEARSEANASRYKELRKISLELPKFGEGQCEELKRLADKVVDRCVKIIRDGIENPVPSVKKAYDNLKKKYSIKGKPFEFTVTPGVGTFEDNLGLGVGMGASPDGRLAGEPIADDFCPAPSPSDMPPMSEPHDIYKGLDDWNVPSINYGLSNASPVDINIYEDFKPDDLQEVIQQFAQGKIGSNLLTVTTANPTTYANAQVYPEKYDLVRVRQGGWSEFYMAMFPEHQAYIARRPYYGVKTSTEKQSLKKKASAKSKGEQAKKNSKKGKKVTNKIVKDA
ncbi:Dyp-type peroxidase [Pleionea sediminis]|uniref:Dyp-type peroxidase n=1 Tax=Pleionea sediminis TaxID=2569479 RepID=UPI0011870391|nr:Dyp-type peroxidase [Pleionea sediminis]